jgi:(R,R)-butanediol dehydrogenase/meso-butanediol dehydrogenase/diacetyl reductase
MRYREFVMNSCTAAKADTMKAVRLHGKGDLRVEDIASPGAPEPGWVRLAVEAAGICGSDLHNFRTGQWITRSPSVAGHEFMGRVSETGTGVTGLAVGDRVVADSRFWCGTCKACLRGQPHLCATLDFVGEVCDGGFAGEVVLPQRLLYRLPDWLPDDIAAMAEPMAVALHCVSRLDADPAGPVLVAGCGPIGGLAALVLAEQGFTNILVADHNHKRLVRVADVTGARPVTLDRSSAGSNIPAAIEATGNVEALRAVIDLMDGGGRIALVGISHGTLDLDPNHLVEREISLVGCHAFCNELPAAVAMLSACASRAARLIDRHISLDEVPNAYRRLIAGEAEGLKTIIRP